MCRAEVDRGVWNEQWSEWLIRCMLTLGRYSDAQREYEAARKRYSNRIGLRLLGHDVYRYVDQPEQAERELGQIYELVRASPWRYGSAQDQITLGRFFVIMGEDSRKVLELIYDPVRERNPKEPEVYLATAELALEKSDAALAAENLQVAANLSPNDPQVAYLEALAWRDSEPAKTAAALQRALQLNPRHVPALLLQADQLIDAERYPESAAVLEQVLEINLYEPKAWAYHAVLANLQGHFEGEQRLRAAALSTWSTNYEVDHLIGRKLSQKYRFAEGAQYQRRALQMRPGYIPAKFHLAQDLLRLGEDAEGWKLAADVQSQDGYNVVAYNLMTLKDQLDRFQTLTANGLIVRMDAREATIYGPEVLELLQTARKELCDKYELQLDLTIAVEVFPRQQDFAIRTFGLPGGSGYLGVCFGPLITANSPAALRSTPSNWQSVLWHEFCHVVTLQKTNHRMPRWLSEGISVYEERQRNPAWGQHMNPEYREMILGGQLTPVSQLSGAFLRPSSPAHLQFAYYESSLVVEFLMERYGMGTLRNVLTDLSVGMPIEISLQRYIGPPEVVDQMFAEYAHQRAEQLAPQLDWRRDVLPEDADLAQLELLNEQHPNNYWLAHRLCQKWIEAGRWELARELLERIHAAYPADTSAGNAASQLATIYRERGESAEEMRVLKALVEHDHEDVEAHVRLMDLAVEAEDWELLRDVARQLLAVNPLIPIGHEMLTRAGERLDHAEDVAAAQRALLEMDPADPALAHYRLSVAYHQLGRTAEARREVMRALEDAPRFRAAQQLLLELIDHDVAP
jgi:tetratricopeptide (TPR) repeat protein